jgi:hypothetical protein
VLAVSCTTGAGVGNSDAIKSGLGRAVGAETLQVAINARHFDALRRGREAAAQAAELLSTSQGWNWSHWNAGWRRNRRGRR